MRAEQRSSRIVDIIKSKIQVDDNTTAELLIAIAKQVEADRTEQQSALTDRIRLHCAKLGAAHDAGRN